jgi:hypothetical protein
METNKRETADKYIYNEVAKRPKIQDSTTNTNTDTPFRKAEKKYKAFKDKKGVSQTDFSDVIDFTNLENNTPQNKLKIKKVEPSMILLESPSSSSSHQDVSWKVYTVSDVPGNKCTRSCL